MLTGASRWRLGGGGNLRVAVWGCTRTLFRISMGVVTMLRPGEAGVGWRVKEGAVESCEVRGREVLARGRETGRGAWPGERDVQNAKEVWAG